MGDGTPWLLRFYRQDALACAFWQQLLAELPLRAVQIRPDDDQDDLLTYLINPPTH
ncbi:hypothetical protein D3C84_1235610 [compost metagenome]